MKVRFGSLTDIGPPRRHVRFAPCSTRGRPSCSASVILLVAVIANTIMFWRIERLAGLLFVPYAAWVTYATILNASLWLLNKT
ncbi:MAG: tryptophan-rich sensory protein [Alphaproteobacteria bacterium]